MSDFGRPSGLPTGGAGGGGDVESQIRAAGRLVHCSDDLRPRTLEAARALRSVNRGAWGTAMAALAAGWLVAVAVHTAREHRESAPNDVVAADIWQLGESVRRQAACAVGGPTWSLADLLLVVRQRQAEILSPRNGAAANP